MDGSGSEPSLPFWARPWICAAIVLLLTVPRIVFAARFDLIGDEAYYAIWSFHPGFGYYDHSPAVAWVIWLGRTIFGESEWAVRSLFVLSGLLVSAALYRTGTLLTGDRRVGAFAAIAYGVTPAVLITFAVATPDGPSTLFWVLAVWAVAEFVGSGRASWWLLAGGFAGLGLLSKYTVVFLGAGLLLFLLSSRERRRWFGLWQVWAGGALAVLLFAPVVWIDGHRGWISFGYQLGRSTLEHPRFGGFGEFGRFLFETSLQVLPTAFILIVAGAALFFARRATALALPVLTSAPMVGYFLVHAVFGRVNPNWVAPLYPELVLIGAWAAWAWPPKALPLRWGTTALKWLHVPVGLIVFALAFNSIATRTIPFMGHVRAFNYVYGWAGLQAKVSALAQANGAAWLQAPNYSLNGWLGYYGRMAGDPLPVWQTSQRYRYTYMPPMDPALRKAAHLVLRQTSLRGEAPPLKGATLLGKVTRDDENGKPLAAYAIYLRATSN